MRPLCEEVAVMYGNCKRAQDRALAWFVISLFLLSPSAAAVGSAGATWHDVRAHGAKGDGLSDDTEAIQRTIDAAAIGGGTVYFPPGRYLTGTVVLRDSITVWLDRGTRVLGNPDRMRLGTIFRDSAGKPFGPAIFLARGVRNVSIRGDGVIDGQGTMENYPPDGSVPRPLILLFEGCENVVVEGVTLVNSAAWVQDYIRCRDVWIRNVTVRSYSNKNNDGLDLDGCERVIVEGCNISSEDDAIVLKSLSLAPCRDVVISNCVISGLKSAIKFGTESAGGFENVTIANCAIYGTRGIDIFSVDGGTVRNITISNISIRDAYGVLAIRLGARMRPYGIPESQRPKGPGTISGITISNVQAVGITESNDFICGIPGHPVTDVTLRNVRVTYRGGGSRRDTERTIPEHEARYPKKRMFGTLPSYGLFIRHARNVVLDDLDLRFEEADERPAIFAEDVTELNIRGLRAMSGPRTPAIIWLRQAHDVWLRETRLVGEAEAFVRVEGRSSGGIRLIDNAVRGARKLVEVSGGARATAVELK